MVDVKELVEALHYIKKFRDQRFIVKFGGEIVLDERVLETIALDLISLRDVGIHLVVIHGAGSQISSAMEGFGLKPAFVRGERVTDRKALDLVIGCLHYANNKIVGMINRDATVAVGLGGNLFKAEKKKDLRHVGSVTSVNSEVVSDLIDGGYIPVVSPIGTDHEGNSLNINADVAAGELAKAVGATKMIVLTNVEGVLDKGGNLVRKLDVSEARKLIVDESVTGGMIPKLESGIKALLEGGVECVHIIKAGEHAILGELLTEEGTGTMITR